LEGIGNQRPNDIADHVTATGATMMMMEQASINGHDELDHDTLYSTGYATFP
jgi:hypothetical protein